MAFSKIILNGVTQIDLTSDTVQASNLIAPNTAHGADGEAIMGTASGGLNAPTFTVTWDDDWENILSVTCNKTFSEVYNYYDENVDTLILIAEYTESNPSEIYLGSGSIFSSGHSSSNPSNDDVKIVIYGGMSPLYDITYYGSGQIVATNPSSLIQNSSDLVVSGATVEVNGGYYEYSTATVALGAAGTPTATKGTVSNHQVSITPSVINTTGYITGGTKNGTAVTVTASELASGNKEITENGTDIDVVGYSTISVDVSSLAVILSDNLHDASEDIANTYIAGSTETAYNGWSSTDYISVKPNTYYRVKNGTGNSYNAFYKSDKSSAQNSVTIPKSSTDDFYVLIETTPDTAYIRMSAATSDTSKIEIYEVSPSFPTGNINITSNGNYSVSEYATASINVSDEPSLQAKTGIVPTTSSQTITADSGYDGLSSVQINAMPSGTASTPATTITANPSISINSSGLITATASASQDVTPSVSAGYVSSGTKGTITVSGSKTQQLTTQAAKTVTPTESEQTAVAANVYTTGIVKVGAISSTYIGSEIVQRDDTDLTVSGATVTVPSGYYADDETKTVASGSASTPATTITANPSITVSSSGLITATTSASQSVTPTVSDGYVSSGTAGTVTVSGSKTQQLTTKGATTYNTSTTDQTIASGTYLTGIQTIKAVTVSGLDASKILSGTTVMIGDANDADRIASVTGSVTFSTITTSSSSPSGGSNGDIWIKTS